MARLYFYHLFRKKLSNEKTQIKPGSSKELSQFLASKHKGPLAFFATEVKKALLLLVALLWPCFKAKPYSELGQLSVEQRTMGQMGANVCGECRLID